jgi:hypothetical protein
LTWFVAFIWLWAGLWKLVESDQFIRALRGHEVLPESVIGYWWIVPVSGVALAAGIVLLSAPSRQSGTGMLVLVVSLLCIVGMSAYVLVVPSNAIASNGCGCRPTVGGEWIGKAAKHVTLLFNSIVLGAHAALLFYLVRKSSPSKELVPTP